MSESRLRMEVNTVTTDSEGRRTASNLMDLGQMKVVDVVKLQLKLAKVVVERLEEQLKELEG